MRPASLAAIVAAISCSPVLGQQADMVCLLTFGTAIVEGAKETTVQVRYLPRAEAEDRVAAGKAATSIEDLSHLYPTNEEERRACEASIATPGTGRLRDLATSPATSIGGSERSH